MTAWVYPEVRRDESVIDVYKSARHGEVNVADPYRWLEDPQADETETFVRGQNTCYESYISDYPHRAELRAAMKETYSYSTISAPDKQGDGYYYYFMKQEHQNQPVLYRTRAPAELESGEVFYDVNAIRTSAGDAALTTFPAPRQPFSKTGKFWAYGVNFKGAAWTTVYVRPTTEPFSGSEDQDGLPKQWAEIKNVKFSTVAWIEDEGFFYQAYPAAVGSDGTELTETLRSRLFYHKLGTQQSEDLVIKEVEDGHPEWRYQANTTEDSRFLVVEIVSAGRNARLWVTDLAEGGWRDGKAEWIKIDNEGASQWSIIGSEASLLYLLTNKDAARFKVVTFGMRNPTKPPVDLVAEDPKALLTVARLFNGDSLLLSYSIDVHSEVWVASLKTGEKTKRLGPSEDQLCNVTAIHASKGSDEAFVETKGFTNPGLLWKIEGSQMTLFKETVMSGLKSEDYITEQVWYTSKDGTRIPMFLTHAKSLRKGPVPALLFAYGGFGSLSSAPAFDASRMTFVRKFHGILACPSVRGGGEYGKDWHLAGCRHNRQTVFDDLQYAARHLIIKKYTTPELITLIGGSNGGLTVMACANQAPELYGGVIAASPILDMVRYTKFGIGKYGIQDIGDPDLPEDIDYILDWSPPHNVSSKKGPYPAVYLQCGRNDDQVPALHSYKTVATLQHLLKNNPKPFMVLIEEGAGHGQGKPTERLVSANADRLAYIAKSLNLVIY